MALILTDVVNLSPWCNACSEPVQPFWLNGKIVHNHSVHYRICEGPIHQAGRSEPKLSPPQHINCRCVSTCP